MKVQVNTIINKINYNTTSTELFNEVLTMRNDVLDPFAFTVSNLIVNDVNYSAPQAGPISIKSLLGVADFTKIVSLNIMLKQLQTDPTCETQSLQCQYSIVTGAGSVAMGSMSQIFLGGLLNSTITDITLSNIPITAANEITVLSLVAVLND